MKQTLLAITALLTLGTAPCCATAPWADNDNEITPDQILEIDLSNYFTIAFLAAADRSPLPHAPDWISPDLPSGQALLTAMRALAIAMSSGSHSFNDCIQAIQPFAQAYLQALS